MKLPNGYGGVVKLSKNRRKRFAARITVGYSENGSPKYKYLSYHETRKEALDALAQYNLNPYDLNGRNLTFRQVYEMWAERELKDAGRSKRYCYEIAFKKCESLYNKKITEIKTPQMQKIIDECPVRSDSTLSNLKKLFNQVSKFALENDYISKSYSSFLKISDITEKRTKTEFSEEEIKILWNHSDDEIISIILILIYTGFRITELLELKTENIFLDEHYCIGGIKTKAGKNRIVPLHSRIIPLIKEFYNKNNNTLLNYKYDAFKTKFYEKLNALNFAKHTIHECRHTTATLLSRYGAEQIAMKKILGHALTDITEGVYIHKNIDELRRAIEVIP